MNCGEVEQFLGAYLDGELDAVHCAQVEAHVSQCESCAKALRAHRELSALVTAAPRYPASSALRQRLGRIPARRPRTMAWVGIAAGLVAIGLVTWHLAPGIHGSDQMAKEAVENHVRSLMAGHLLDVSAGEPLARWFGKRLDYEPDVVDLSWRGFALSGGRLDSLGGRNVAALVYQRDGHVINVFIRPAGEQSERAPSVRPMDRYTVVSWVANGMSWWAVSDLDARELGEISVCPCFLPVNRTLRADSLVKPG